MKKKIYFVNGALGSGKTTLINQLILSGKLGKFFIIENEVSNFTVDNMCLHVDPKQIKVFSGECICCSDPKELINVLTKVAGQDYECVVIESSGVTSLNQLLINILVERSIEEKFEIGGCIFLVDALGIGRTSVNDLELADFVIVTKFEELQSITQSERLNNFIKVEHKTINFLIKENLQDYKWIDKLLDSEIISFREWSLKINDKKHHGDNFIKVLQGDALNNFDKDFAFENMSLYQVNRIKGFYKKGSKILHVEMTPELLKEDEVQNVTNTTLGIVIIGSNKLLLEEFVNLKE